MQDQERFNNNYKEVKKVKEKFDRARDYIRNYYKMYKNNTKNKIQSCISNMHKLRISIKDSYLYCGGQKS